MDDSPRPKSMHDKKITCKEEEIYFVKNYIIKCRSKQKKKKVICTLDFDPEIVTQTIVRYFSADKCSKQTELVTKPIELADIKK